MTVVEEACEVPDCKVAYWTKVVESGKWEGKAISKGDARLALGSSELVCYAFHQGKSKQARSLDRHVKGALRYAAVQMCVRNNCGTVCLCGPCHARKALEIIDPEWRP